MTSDEDARFDKMLSDAEALKAKIDRAEKLEVEERDLAYNSPMVDSPGQTVATSPLLETNLYIPKWHSGLVARARLIEGLDQGTECKLTLVSAPAGSGKTQRVGYHANDTVARGNHR